MSSFSEGYRDGKSYGRRLMKEQHIGVLTAIAKCQTIDEVKAIVNSQFLQFGINTISYLQRLDIFYNCPCGQFYSNAIASS